MESGQHKKKINYTVMIVSDAPDGGIQPFYLERNLVSILLGLIAIILAVAIGIAIHHSIVLDKIRSHENLLQQQVDKLTEENQTLLADNSELSDKVTILSNTVNQNTETVMAQEKEEEEKKIPSGFPLAGPAVILESSETVKAEGETEGEAEDADTVKKDPIVVFSSSEGTKVIASASGLVKSVEADDEYGYRIVVDHENGYTSIYRAPSEPKIEEGVKVEVGQTLFEIGNANDKLGYQITKGNTLIDPLDLLEVYG